MKPIVITLGLGGLAAWLLTKKAASAAADVVVEKNGHKWLLRAVPPAPGVIGSETVNVFAPAGSWGPHSELLVVRYTRAIAPTAQKILAGVGSGVPVAMRDAALADLGIKTPGT